MIIGKILTDSSRVSSQIQEIRALSQIHIEIEFKIIE